jgi:uncharacterized damage-inducible protein DinB
LKPEPEITLLLDALDEAFERHSWHGPNLRGAVRGVSAADAIRRPKPDRHNIAEVTVHAAYWKYVVRRMLTGGKRGTFPSKGSNWFPRAELDAAQWRRDLEMLVDEHRKLRAAVKDFPAADLGKRSPKKRYTMAQLIRGIAAHDLYHAGQIQLLKRLVR